MTFSRSGVKSPWDQSCATLLDLAEASGVQAPSGCRSAPATAAARRCSPGSVSHDPDRSTRRPPGSALLCCARPEGDVVLDA